MTKRDIARAKIDLIELELILSPFLPAREVALVMQLAREARSALTVEPG